MIVFLAPKWFIFKVFFFKLKIVYKALTIKNYHKKIQNLGPIIHMAVVIN